MTTSDVMGIQVPVEGRPEVAPGADSLVGVEQNAFFIMGHTQKVLRRAGASAEYVQAYVAEATSGKYDHLVLASMAYLDAGVGGPGWPNDELQGPADPREAWPVDHAEGE